ncbi:MAG: pyridoxal 5'-phosphate synthase glutaminase subunit PdxT [Methanoregulaceae archaeon]|nr:pyridoxal 5'-phosphate synthase glutaminase subunit PdxT [Methanoregulaceae archaeon]
MGVRIGVLAVQGNVSEHVHAFRGALGHMGCVASEVLQVRDAGTIPTLDGLAIPGGESTTISRLIDKNCMRKAIEDFEGGIFATCAGMVLVSSDSGDPKVEPLGIIGMSVDRNAFGRQRESFETELKIEGLTGGDFHAIFIRAPIVTRVDASVRVISRISQGIVAVEKGKHMALSFHPELGNDTRLHERFLEKIGN